MLLLLLLNKHKLKAEKVLLLSQQRLISNSALCNVVVAWLILSLGTWFKRFRESNYFWWWWTTKIVCGMPPTVLHKQSLSSQLPSATKWLRKKYTQTVNKRRKKWKIVPKISVKIYEPNGLHAVVVLLFLSQCNDSTNWRPVNASEAAINSSSARSQWCIITHRTDWYFLSLTKTRALSSSLPPSQAHFIEIVALTPKHLNCPFLLCASGRRTI